MDRSPPRFHTAEAAAAYLPTTPYSQMADLLDADIANEADIVRLTETGVGARAYKRAAKVLGFPHSLIAPETTVRRRLKENARFSEAESERLIRLARVYAEAVALFGDEAAALQWLNTPQAFIPGDAPVSPLRLSAKDSGARLVESLMRRTAHGMF
ncbi:antitoxin Xre-like helix-turn-helix domain-containing protein [Solilutibacter pythonis]|nr:antitoxin Xre-like helix-turn-helix domain-containing protein [Lysobacter pythonis]